MKLKTRFIILSAFSILAAMATSLESRISDAETMAISDKQQLAAQVIQRHMDGDMRHEGIRGDVYSALYAMQTGNKELLAQTHENMLKMQMEFEDFITKNLQQDLPEEIKRNLFGVQQAVTKYNQYANEVMKSDSADAAQKFLPDFNKQFNELDVAQAKVSQQLLGWTESLGKEEDAINEQAYYRMFALQGFSILVAVLVFLFAVLSIFRPLRQMMDAMQRIAGGDAATSIPHTQRKDEMGDMAKTVQVFKDNAQKIELMNKEREAQKLEAERQKRQAMHELANSFEQSVKTVVSQVNSSATQMQAGAEGVTQIASDTKNRSTQVANLSTEAAQSSAQVAAAAEQLTASIREISHQTQKSNQIADEASGRAESAKQAIELLSEKSSRVNEIIEVITSIAEQINLLALNATIESARAGEAGKGFAVVASEVKNLAAQVSKATDEITQQIHEMQGATQSSVDSVMQILGIISQVSGSTAAVAAAVEEQSAVTNEIAQNITRTAAGTQEISKHMSTVQDGANLTGDTAKEVLDAAKHLGEQSGMLKQKIDEFLNTVRAA